MTKEMQAMIVGMRIVSLELGEIALIVERQIPTISRIISSYHEYGSIELLKWFEDLRSYQIVLGQVFEERCSTIIVLLWLK